jgi:hypothetical protein
VSFFNASGAIRLKAGEKTESIEGEKPNKPAKANLDNYLDWVHQLGL